MGTIIREHFGINLTQQFRISPSVIKLMTDRFDPTKGFIYLKPDDPKTLYKIAYAFADLEYITRSKEASKLYVIFNTNSKFTNFRNLTLSMNKELKKLSAII